MSRGGAEPFDLVVIGGGVAGLVAARCAARTGSRVAVVEAAPVVGGLVGSHVVDDLRLDRGAESFATRGAHVAQLASDLGLRIVTPDPAPARVLYQGRLVRLPATGVLGIPTDLDAPGLTDALGQDGLARARQDLQLPVGELASTAGSATGSTTGSGTAGAAVTTALPTLADLVASRMGTAVLDRLVRPIVRGVHSCEPEQLPAERVLPGVGERMARTGSLAAALAEQRAGAPAGSAVAGIDGGMYRLPQALAADLTAHEGRVHTSSPVRALIGDRAGGWQVSGDGWQISAPRVLLACPPHTWGFLTGALGRTGLEEVAAAARAWPPARPIDLLTLVLRAGAVPDHARAGTLVADPGDGAKALTYASSKWQWVARAAGPERLVLRLSYQAGILPDEPQARTGYGLRDAARLTGTTAPWPEAALLDLARTRLHRPTSPDDERRARLAAAVGRTEGLDITGAWWAGSGLAAVVAHAARTADESDPA